ncbi:MAG: ATP-grasp domain-containing protein [Christensenellales bacterium]
MKKYYIGPKQITIQNNNFFDGSITLFGDNSNNNISYSKELTFEYWNPDNTPKEIEIYNKEMKQVSEEILLMAHNPQTVLKCDIPSNYQLICLNDEGVLEILNNKLKTRELLLDIVPQLKYITMKGTDISINTIQKFTPERLVIQHPLGSGGAKTFLCDQTNFEQIKRNLLDNEYYTISVYQKNNIPYNIHCVIGEKNTIVFPPTEQDLEITDKIEYVSSKINISFSKKIKNKLLKYSEIICDKIKSIGYKGVLGIDYIWVNNELYFIEINPRFQGSTRFIDKLLVNNNLPSLFEYNYMAFNGEILPTLKDVPNSVY